MSADWWGIIVAAVIGLGGWVFAGFAKRDAKLANVTAKDAVAKAGEANRIAEHANKLSEQANTLAERSATQQTEDWLVKWDLEWNQAGSLLVLKQRGRDDAMDASVVVTGHNVHETKRWEDPVPPRQDITIDVPQVIGERNKNAAETARVVATAQQGGISYFPVSFEMELEVTVTWRTGAGFPDSDTQKLKVS